MPQRLLATSLAAASLFASVAPAGPGAPPATPPGAPTARATDADKRDRIAEVVAKAMDKAHGGARYRTRSVLQCDLALTSGDVSVNAKLTYQINGSAARLDFADGAAIVFDGTECWVSPSTHAVPGGTARQRVLTLRNLVAAPFMSQDRAAKVSKYRSMMIMGTDGDAFDVQWTLGGASPPLTLVAYAEARSHQLSVIGCEAMAGSLGLPEGEKAVHCVVFTEPVMVEDVLMPTKWLLYDWTEAASVRGDKLGTVTISGVKFLRSDEASFAMPAGSRKDLVETSANTETKP